MNMKKLTGWVLAFMVGYFGVSIATKTGKEYYVDSILLYASVIISLILLTIDRIKNGN